MNGTVRVLLGALVGYLVGILVLLVLRLKGVL